MFVEKLGEIAALGGLQIKEKKLHLVCRLLLEKKNRRPEGLQGLRRSCGSAIVDLYGHIAGAVEIKCPSVFFVIGAGRSHREEQTRRIPRTHERGHRDRGDKAIFIEDSLRKLAHAAVFVNAAVFRWPFRLDDVVTEPGRTESGPRTGVLHCESRQTNEQQEDCAPV